MAFSLNRIELIGNVGKDPESRFTTNNSEVMSFTLATTNSYKGKDGNWVKETTWHYITQFSPTEYQKSNIKKGSKLFVEGRLTKRPYTDKDGNKRESVEVLCNSIVFLDGRDGFNAESSGGGFTPPSDSPSGPVNDGPVDDLPF